jgi:energy-coupling factor transporter ATP-binding protein EcfA2
MYIQKLVVQNIRGIGEGERGIDLDLRRPDDSYAGWTVLAGRNGSGKTTLLQAIALTIAGPRATRNFVKDNTWRRTDATKCHVQLTLVPTTGDDKPPKGAPRKHPFDVGLEFVATESLYPEKWTGMEEGKSGPWQENPTGWFFAGYGPFRRLSGHSPEAASLQSGGSSSELVTLFREDASLSEGVAALRKINYQRLEKKKGAEELEQGSLALLNDGLLPGDVKVEGIDSEVLWVRSKEGVRLKLDAISDGYRVTVALVLDILRQMGRFFPDFHIEYKDGRPFVPYSGVILLDEAELHLHVSWQQRIGFWLKEHFPKIQFLVTTHSPFICQAADPGGLIRLRPAPEEPAAEQLSEEEYNRVVNDGADSAVITSLFGLETPYSAVADERRDRISQLEAKQLQGIALGEHEATELLQLQRQIPNTASAAVEAVLRRLEMVR